MSRGHYGFQNEYEHCSYKHVMTVIVNSLITNIDQDGIELTHIDISPTQVKDILDELGWERYEGDRDRDTIWEYFYHEDYPTKMMSLITDIDLFSMTIDIVDREEG